MKTWLIIMVHRVVTSRNDVRVNFFFHTVSISWLRVMIYSNAMRAIM